MELSFSLALSFVIGVCFCLLLLYGIFRYYLWKKRREDSDQIRLVLDLPISEDQYADIQEQMDGRSLGNVVLHALEIRGFLHESYVRGHSVYVEDGENERELDFDFETEQSSNTTIH